MISITPTADLEHSFIINTPITAAEENKFTTPGFLTASTDPYCNQKVEL
jgi:hypothetical protein